MAGSQVGTKNTWLKDMDQTENKDATMSKKNDLEMYNSDEEVAGNDGTPDISKNKV